MAGPHRGIRAHGHERRTVEIRSRCLTAARAATVALMAIAVSALAVGCAPANPERQALASWNVLDPAHATGSDGRGLTARVTLTGQFRFEMPGDLLYEGFDQGVVAYLPDITALRIARPITCQGPEKACGSIRFTFSKAVTAPRLYIGDIGAGVTATSNTWGAFSDTPLTVTNGSTLSFAAPASHSASVTIWNSARTVGISQADVAAMIGEDASSMHAACVSLQCAVVDVHTPTGSVRTLTFSGAVAESPASVAWDHFSLAVAVAPEQGPPWLLFGIIAAAVVLAVSTLGFWIWNRRRRRVQPNAATWR